MHITGEVSLGQLFIGLLLTSITIIMSQINGSIKDLKTDHAKLKEDFDQHSKDYEIHTFPNVHAG